MSHAVAYPDSAPVADIQILIGAITTGERDVPELAHAAWCVQGYVQSLTLGTAAPLFGAAQDFDPTPSDLNAKLAMEQLLPKRDGVVSASLPSKAVLLMLLDWVAAFLREQINR